MDRMEPLIMGLLIDTNKNRIKDFCTHSSHVLGYIRNICNVKDYFEQRLPLVFEILFSQNVYTCSSIWKKIYEKVNLPKYIIPISMYSADICILCRNIYGVETDVNANLPNWYSSPPV